jgi:pyridoxamine 5'-phosphate oxidase
MSAWPEIALRIGFVGLALVAWFWTQRLISAKAPANHGVGDRLHDWSAPLHGWLTANPRASLVFHWIDLEREVRIDGRVEKVTAAESDEYFASRPLGSRHAAIASPQSETVASRDVLEARFAAAAADHGETPARPAHWGGYRVLPSQVEFWQGRPSRLHDRLLYTRTGDRWTLSRLAP